ncbi:hypothetical protein VNO78_29123 [Psophocarpus tetragonolobus]|uniref:Uncharacterized protein n=1 Tax=Psophocarpus tetragonolobus TaxID=3891 RepID=A0AAN9X0P5_PSOTE
MVKCNSNLEGECINGPRHDSLMIGSLDVQLGSRSREVQCPKVPSVPSSSVELHDVPISLADKVTAPIMRHKWDAPSREEEVVMVTQCSLNKNLWKESCYGVLGKTLELLVLSLKKK